MMARRHAMPRRTTKAATVFAKMIFRDLFPLMFVSTKRPMFTHLYSPSNGSIEEKITHIQK